MHGCVIAEIVFSLNFNEHDQMKPLFGGTQIANQDRVINRPDLADFKASMTRVDLVRVHVASLLSPNGNALPLSVNQLFLSS